jgi:hypothetical protein
MRTSSTVRIQCEGLVEAHADARPCPVRFEWVGPTREDPSPDDEMRDARSALNAAEELGWSFRTVATLCPRHAALTLEASDAKETVRG